MDVTRVRLLRELLSSTGWIDRSRDFARALRRSTDKEQGLLLVGTPTEEPWHFAAHLDDESRYAGLPGLSPTLVRWNPPPGAPPHLAVGLDRLEAARRGETLFVVAPDAAPEDLLERVDDARRIGATILTMDAGDKELEGLAHESLIVPSRGLIAPTDVEVMSIGLANAGLFDLDLTSPSVSFDTVSHLVSSAAGEVEMTNAGRDTSSRRGFRDRLGRLLENIEGPNPSDD